MIKNDCTVHENGEWMSMYDSLAKNQHNNILLLLLWGTLNLIVKPNAVSSRHCVEIKMTGSRWQSTSSKNVDC